MNFSILFKGGSDLDWQCKDCSIIHEDDSVIVENRFTEPNDFELSTEIYILESQNVRLTVQLEDYVAVLIQDWIR